MPQLYSHGVTPSQAVEGTLARWYAHYLRTNGHEPPPDVTRLVRSKIERIASRRDRRLSLRGIQ